MSALDTEAGPTTPTFFSLRTAGGLAVAKDPSSCNLRVASPSDGAVLFQMAAASHPTEDLVLLQTVGGRMDVRADPSGGVVLHDCSADQSPFVRVAVGDGFALGTPDRRTWLSVSGGGRVVLAERSAPGEPETFIASAEGLPADGTCCCGPSGAPSAALWDDKGHETIVRQGIRSMRDPWSPTLESQEFLRILDSDPAHLDDLLKGLWEADYDYTLKDGGFYTSHFYDPDTEQNYWGQYGLGPNPGETALQRGSRYFASSWHAYVSGASSAESPFELLGIAAHYLTDLTQPMHAANIANAYGDHPPFPLVDLRHSRFEDYAEEVARSGQLFEDYPRLTVEEMSIAGITGVEVLYHQVAKASKQVWLDQVRPIYEQKRYLEAWGPEAHDALVRATHMAPVAVAKFFSYWALQILDASSRTAG
jgi:hypothetical protein